MVLIEKLLLAMVGHNLVRISRADLEEDTNEGNKAVAKELLRTGKAYVELTAIVSSLRARSDHDRLSEVFVQAIETYSLDDYLEKLCQAEQEALRGPVHVLRVKWLVASHIRAFPELIGLAKRCRDPGKILRVLADAKLSSSPLTTTVLHKALENSYEVLREAITQWIFTGELQREAGAYFFVRDTGAIQIFDPRARRRKRIRLLNAFSLMQFQVVLDRVPLESRFSLEWANRICFIGTVSRFLLYRLNRHRALSSSKATSKTTTSSTAVEPFEEDEDIPPPPPPIVEDVQMIVDEQKNVFSGVLHAFERRFEVMEDEVIDESEERGGAPLLVNSKETAQKPKIPLSSFSSFSDVLLSQRSDEFGKVAFDCFDETQLNALYELADKEMRALFLREEFGPILKLVRDTFFLGRGELFRAAMDTMDFEEACMVCNASDIFGFVNWTPMRNALNVRTSAMMFCGYEVNDEQQKNECVFSLGKENDEGWMAFQDKIWVEEGFVLAIGEIAVAGEGSSIALSAHSSSMLSHAMTQVHPALSLIITCSKCALYLDGIFVDEHAFTFEEDNIKEQRIFTQLEMRHFQSEDSRRIQVKFGNTMAIDFAFEDPLVLPKWMDPHGRTYFGVVMRRSKPSQNLSLKSLAVDALATEQSLPFPKLSVKRDLAYFPFDLMEDLNGAFVALFRLKRSHELLSQSWSRWKRDDDNETAKLRFVMAKLVASLVHYFQINLIDAAFRDLKDQVSINIAQAPVIHLEYLLSFTKLALERVVARCSLNNSVLKAALEEVLAVCDAFSSSSSPSATDAKEGFRIAVLSFINVLRRSGSSSALELAEAIDFSGYWMQQLRETAALPDGE